MLNRPVRNAGGETYADWYKDLTVHAKERNISMEELKIYNLHTYWAEGLDALTVVTMLDTDKEIPPPIDSDVIDDYPGEENQVHWWLRKKK